jgi:hypothetical protein
MTSAQRRYAIVSFVIGPAVANALINGLLGWATFRGVRHVPIWGLGPSVGPDTLGTCFFLPFFTCLIVTAVTRRHVRRGQVPPLVEVPVVLRTLQGALGRLVGRALAVGLTTFVVVGGFVSAVSMSLDTETMTYGSFLTFKIGFSVALGLVVTPPLGLLALAD